MTSCAPSAASDMKATVEVTALPFERTGSPVSLSTTVPVAVWSVYVAAASQSDSGKVVACKDPVRIPPSIQGFPLGIRVAALDRGLFVMLRQRPLARPGCRFSAVQRTFGSTHAGVLAKILSRDNPLVSLSSTSAQPFLPTRRSSPPWDPLVSVASNSSLVGTLCQKTSDG